MDLIQLSFFLRSASPVFFLLPIFFFRAKLRWVFRLFAHFSLVCLSNIFQAYITLRRIGFLFFIVLCTFSLIHMWTIFRHNKSLVSLFYISSSFYFLFFGFFSSSSVFRFRLVCCVFWDIFFSTIFLFVCWFFLKKSCRCFFSIKEFVSRDDSDDQSALVFTWMHNTCERMLTKKKSTHTTVKDNCWSST